jgi:large conductance mechanosensitive channel
MFKEFKEFAMKGNVVDMAVGIIIGAAFGAIVNSLVTDIVTPIIGVITGGLDFSSRYLLLKDGNPPAPYATVAAAKAAGAVTINIGSFISLVLNFVIVAFVLFIIIKMMNQMRRKEPTPAPAAAPALTTDQRLLTEIRDLLKTEQVRAGR